MNLFKKVPTNLEEEISEPLVAGKNILIERIISAGQASPEGFWYNQAQDEWVALLQGRAKLAWKNGRELVLEAGDWVLLPAGEEHRVAETSVDPPCIWLAVHGKMC